MRLNKFLARNTSLSRRKADEAIAEGRVEVDDGNSDLSLPINDSSKVKLDGQLVVNNMEDIIVLLVNKPEGYISSRDGQGSKTVYDLIPEEYKKLNIAGRLDKDSSGLMLLTNDGELLNELTHPSNNKVKIYEVTLDKPITPSHLQKILTGVNIGDKRPSKMQIQNMTTGNKYSVSLTEGRNRQIRRTFSSLGYKVVALHRTKISSFNISYLKDNRYIIV